jgi:hypothetical protein
MGSGGRLALFKPPRFARPAPGDKAGDTDVLIEVRPVNALAATDEAPIGTLGGGPVGQTREPTEWHRNRAAVG